MKTFRIKPYIIAISLLICFDQTVAAAENNDYNSTINKQQDIGGISSLMSAVIDGDLEGVKFFSKSGYQIVNQKNIGGATALHLAARSNGINSTKIAQILIENGANINSVDNENWTPLMRAALAKNDKVVDLLVSSGADVGKHNMTGDTAIINAASSGCSQCLRSIFIKSNYNQLNPQELKQQINAAYDITLHKNDGESQAVLMDIVHSIESNKEMKSDLLHNKHNESSTNAPLNQTQKKQSFATIPDSNPLQKKKTYHFSGTHSSLSKEQKESDISNNNPPSKQAKGKLGIKNLSNISATSKTNSIIHAKSGKITLRKRKYVLIKGASAIDLSKKENTQKAKTNKINQSNNSSNLKQEKVTIEQGIKISSDLNQNLVAQSPSTTQSKVAASTVVSDNKKLIKKVYIFKKTLDANSKSK